MLFVDQVFQLENEFRTGPVTKRPYETGKGARIPPGVGLSVTFVQKPAQKMNYSVLDDSDLLRLLLPGDDRAFREVYDRYWKLLFYTAHNIIQDRDVAQDVVQEVFIALWQRRGEVAIQSLKAYLQQATRFQTLKAIRAQKTDDQFYSRLATVTADIVYENPLLFKEQEALLRKILGSLPDDCRHIFHLSREEQLTYKQIACQLNISEKTVEKKMSICLKHIRQALEQNEARSLLLLLASCGLCQALQGAFLPG
jgi:RNA polymerase sigma-70 factor (family 1)